MLFRTEQLKSVSPDMPHEERKTMESAEEDIDSQEAHKRKKIAENVAAVRPLIGSRYP